MSFESNLKDRKLGHEWHGWDGNIEAHEGFINESKWLYLIIILSVFAVIYLLLCLAAWAIHPLVAAHHWLWGAVIAGGLMMVLVIFVFFWGSAACALWLKRPVWLSEYAAQRFIRTFGIIVFFTEKTGLSRDRLGSSLIAMNNELTRAAPRRIRNGRILCLAPRCLDRDTFALIQEMTREHGCDFFIAPNGVQARQRVAGTRPGAIIAIACERDLVTGIRDAGEHIPVIAIPNKRPAGPCKGATIDIAALRCAIEFFKERACGARDTENTPPPDKHGQARTSTDKHGRPRTNTDEERGGGLRTNTDKQI
ncbi:MAG: DUF116 domain-containing protein [bacterium]